VHLEKYKWQRKQRFYVWFESAAPVYVGFWQDYDGKAPSRKVLPDERFPQSYSAILPGQPFRFPVLLEMDNDLNNEFMSIEVVLANNPDVPINKPNAVDMNPPPGMPPGLDKGIMKKHDQAMVDLMAKARKDPRFKFNPTPDGMNPMVPPSVPPPPPGQQFNPDEVAIIAVAREGFSHIQLRLKKD
jgi:hypothetical protein